LSSTFFDMEAERSALVKRFNKLKLEANRRNVSLSLLDLRWGVTEEETRTGKVLSVCLNEIENSHPFFIGLLGSRYGYAPKMTEIEKNPDLKERYPWICEDIAQERSITEIEMQYGVLRNQEGVDAAFFIKAMPNTQPDDCEKLTNLKNKIRNQQHFPVGDYTAIEDLCDQVEKVVMALLDKYFSDADNTRIGRERSIQRAYMNSRHKFYIRKQEDFDRLNEFLRNDERHLVVTGASGMGKSALIANWLKELEKQKNCPYNIIYHFVGNTFGGNSHEEILQHLSDEMFDLYDGLEVKLGNYESPEEKAQRYMTEAVQKGKPMLIVIDGINQISKRNNAKLLNWLPQSPENVKYLFSTLRDDATMQTFFRLEYPTYTVEPLNDELRSQFIVEYLEKVGKHLDENQLSRILHDSENENTLVLRTLLDELICFGSYEHLNKRIDYYLSATSIPDFFDRMLHRMEDDYEEVRRLLSLIVVSEHGLSEEELIVMTGLRQMDYHQFYCAISAHIVTRNGLLTFGHQYMTDAVWNRYHLDDMDSAKPYRESIIVFFNSNEIIDHNRRISELAFQYYHTDDCENLYKTILSFEVFRMFNATSEGKAVLASYWRKLLKADPEKYQLRNYLDLPYEGIAIEDLPYLEIGVFAQVYMADYQTSLRYTQTFLLMAQFSGKDETPDIAQSHNNIGVVYYWLGDYDHALEYYSKALAIRENVLGLEHPKTAESYSNIGAVYDRLGDYDHALEYYSKAQAIRDSFLGQEHPDTAGLYNNIGGVYKRLGNYDRALECHFKAQAIREKVLGLEHPDTALSYNNIGLVYHSLGDYDKALEYCFKALAITEKVLGLEHPITAHSYNNIGFVYHSLDDYDKALEYYSKALAIREKVLGLEHPDTAISYHSIGGVYHSLDDYDKALEYYSKALAIWEKVIGLEHPDTAQSYSNIGAVYDNLGDYDKALEYYSKALTIREKVIGLEHPDTATSYNDIGGVFDSLGDYDKALEYYSKALAIREKVLGLEHPNTATSYNNIGGVFDSLGEYDKALEYCFKALAIREKILGLEHHSTATSYNNIGCVYYSLGDYDKALEYYYKDLAICEKVLGLEHPNTALVYNNIGGVFDSLGEYDKALEYCFKALAIREKLLGLEHPDTATSYNNIGFVYDSLGEYHKALEYYSKALDIRKKVLGSENPDTKNILEKIDAIKRKLEEQEK